MDELRWTVEPCSQPSWCVQHDWIPQNWHSLVPLYSVIREGKHSGSPADLNSPDFSRSYEIWAQSGFSLHFCYLW